MDVGIIYHAGFLASNELSHKPYLCIDMNETAVFFIDKKYIYVRVSSEQLSRSPGTGRQFISCQIFAVARQISSCRFAVERNMASWLLEAFLLILSVQV